MEKPSIYNSLNERLVDFEHIINNLDALVEHNQSLCDEYSSRKGMLAEHMLPMYQEKLQQTKQCRDNLQFVADFTKSYLEAQGETVAKPSFYKPRVLLAMSDIGKYRTEVEKMKKSYETILFTFKMSHDEEGMAKAQECIEKLKYVYSTITKLKK